MRFVFGYDAKANLIAKAANVGDELYHQLVGRAERVIATRARTRPNNVKDAVVRARELKTLRTTAEDVVEFAYRPGKCAQDYRIVALRKNLSVERGENVLFDEYRYFFYITNDKTLTADEVVGEAWHRCNQENSSPSSKKACAPCTSRSHPQRELGLHGHGHPRLDPESLVRAAAAGSPPLGRPPP